ncbi:MAG: glycoside hydrolase family 3 protein [Deltaproteobacteria bacterium]|jgi:beta-N-acetylhexosaminidase|nr:glycoside hydrolase family 3 protein [Deltaproteobacteria bacterium]
MKKSLCLYVLFALLLAWLAPAPHSFAAQKQPVPRPGQFTGQDADFSTFTGRFGYTTAGQTEAPEKMLGQMLMVGFRGTGEGDPAYAEDFKAIRALVAAGKIGGVILFSRDITTGTYERNIYSPEQVKALCASLQAAASRLLFVAVDQEGGRIRRLLPKQGFTPVPSPAVMGGMPAESVYKIGLRLGKELNGLGININLAPSLDLNINPDNPIIGKLGRSFGRETAVVARQAAAFSRGLIAAGVLPCFKHFPGHGSSKGDSHLGFTDITGSWFKDELAPYAVLPKPNGPYLVMLGHLYHAGLDNTYPASLSGRIIQEILRGDLNWQGVVISDDLQMQAISDHYSLEETILLAINAGNDILLFGNNQQYDPELPVKVWATMQKLYREGKISAGRIEESYQRIMCLKTWLAEKRQGNNQFPD